MHWAQIIAVIFSVFGMGIGIILFMIREMRQISKDINAESRDFHGRLCRLEERYLDMKGKK